MRETIRVRLEPAPVSAQGLQQRRADGQVAVLAALAVDHVNDHALAVDVGAVEHHQQGALEQATAGLDQPGHFFPAQDVGQLPAHLGIGQELAELVPVQGAHEEESQCGHAVLDRSRTEFSLLEQVGLIAAQVIGAKLVGRLAEVLCEWWRRCSCGARVPRASSCEGELQ